MRINILKSSSLKVVVLFVLFTAANAVLAQPCDPKWDRTVSSNCTNSPIKFVANAIGRTSFEWEFGDGVGTGVGTTSQFRDPTHAFTTPGIYIATMKAYGGPGTCSDTVIITIKESPRIKMVDISPLQQCFLGNKFCFIDSTKAATKSKLLSMKYLFSDSTLYTKSNPKLGDTICHSFTKGQGQSYNLTVVAEDSNGCYSKIVLPGSRGVFPKIGVQFTSDKPDSCVQGTMTLKNTTDTFTKLNDIAKFEWDFGNPGSTDNIITGDSNTNTQWYRGATGNGIKHRYDLTGKPSGAYVFHATLRVDTKYGCTETFTYKAVATIGVLNARIFAEDDSSCASNPMVKFSPLDISTGLPLQKVSSFLWTFGDPTTGPENTNDKYLNGATHNFSTGVWMTSLRLNYGPCKLTLFDTIIKIGPSTKIEIPFNRVPENEKYQSVIRDSVHFTNNSTFYHNDANLKYEDSVINGKYVFKWPGDQTAVPSKFPILTQRHKDNVLRLWDFGDSYAPQCTTDTKKNKNVSLNCNWSYDSLPVHWYTPWDQVYKYHNSGELSSTPVDKTVLCKGGKFCFNVKYYKQTSLVIPADTLVIVAKDSTFNYAGRTITPSTKEITAGKFRIKKVTSKFKGQATYTPTLSDETWRFYTNGTIAIKNIITGNQYTKGAGTWTLKKGDQFELKKGDSAMLSSQVWTTTTKTIAAQPTTVCIDTVIGGRDTFIQRSRVFADSNIHKKDFYLKYSKCYAATLYQEDTVNALRCKSSNTVSLALVAPSSEGLTFEGISCYAPPSPPYGMTFSVAETKPGCSQRLMKFNFDSAAGTNNWTTHGGFLAPPLPGNQPWHIGYQLSGAYPTSFVMPYGAWGIQLKNPGWVTVGLIIGNGRLVGGVPESLDTTWYHNAFRYLFMDAGFSIIQPEKDKKTVCVGETITFWPYSPLMDSITHLVWNWNDDQSSYYEERTSYYKPYPGPRPNRSDSIIKDWKPGDKWLYNYVIRLEYDGFNFKTLDTIVTGIMRKWSIAANKSKPNPTVEKAFKAIGLNYRDIPADEVGMYLGNGSGKGCIDTTGFGKLIGFGVAPYRDALTYKKGTTWYRYTDYSKANSVIVSQKLHWRDSSQAGWDTLKQATVNKHSGLKVTPGVYRHVYKKANRYFPTFQLRNTQGCFQARNKEVDVGFYSKWTFSDTITCGNSPIVLGDDIHYFAYEDPFVWLDPKEYWKDGKRFVGGRETKKLDFNEHDDTLPGKIFDVTGLGVPPFAWSYKVPGIYTIRIAMKDSMGCKDTFSQKIYVKSMKAGFKLTRSSNVCDNIVSFEDTSSDTDPVIDYTWDFGDGTQQSKLQNPVHKYEQLGTFNVFLKIKTKLGCRDSITQKITISGPQPFFKRNNDSIVCVGDSVRFDNLSKDPIYNPAWEWDFGDGSVLSHSGARKSVKHAYASAGSYKVHLTLFDDIQGTSQRCKAIYPIASDTSFIVEVVICGKIAKTNMPNIAIYPNPAYDLIYIKGIKQGEVIIFDLSGKEVLRKEIDNSQSIDVSKLTKGTYFIRCSDGTLSYNGRFVKVM